MGKFALLSFFISLSAFCLETEPNEGVGIFGQDPPPAWSVYIMADVCRAADSTGDPLLATEPRQYHLYAQVNLEFDPIRVRASLSPDETKLGILMESRTINCAAYERYALDGILDGGKFPELRPTDFPKRVEYDELWHTSFTDRFCAEGFNKNSTADHLAEVVLRPREQDIYIYRTPDFKLPLPEEPGWAAATIEERTLHCHSILQFTRNYLRWWQEYRLPRIEGEIRGAKESIERLRGDPDWRGVVQLIEANLTGYRNSRTFILGAIQIYQNKIQAMEATLMPEQETSR